MATRQAVREELATRLTAALVTPPSSPLQVVYEYPPVDFGAQWPAVTLTPNGTAYKPGKFGIQHTDHIIDLHLWVLFARVTEDGALELLSNGDAVWTPQNATDAIDTISAQIAEFVQENQKAPALWGGITYRAPTGVELIDIGGLAFLREAFQLTLIDP